MKISAVYQIINTITNDRYVGSSKDVKRRWTHHKCPSVWKDHPNSPMYLDMQKYGLDKFRFQILAPVMPKYLKQVEQEFIDVLKPTYNNTRAYGLDVERLKTWYQSDKGKESMRKALKRYRDKTKTKEARRKYDKDRNNQLCSYNGEALTFSALYMRFSRAGIEHPVIEARKYLIKEKK